MTDSAQPFAAKKFLEIKGRRMAYIDEGRRRSYRFRAWKPDLILSVAQRHAGLSWPGPADCLRHDRDGRFRETSRLWPRPLHLRRVGLASTLRCSTIRLMSERSILCFKPGFST
jgi:hypothetical protein